MKIREILLNLEEFTNLESSEVAEACELLMELMQYPDYLSDNFKQALEEEICLQLAQYHEFGFIKTTSIDVPATTKKVKHIEPH